MDKLNMLSSILRKIFLSESRRSITTGRFLIPMALALIGLVGAGVIYYATVWGPLVFSDAVAYLDAARNFIGGHGLGSFGASGTFHPLMHYPPAYPLVIALFGAFRTNLVVVARWLDIALFGFTICLLEYITYRLTRTVLLALSVALLVVVSPVQVVVFTGVMSESLAIFAGTLSLCLLHLHNERRSSILMLAAILAAGLAGLTRYVSVAYIVAGAVVLVVFSRSSWKRRLADAFIFGLGSGSFVLLWFAWVYLNSHLVGYRSMHFDPGFQAAFQTFRIYTASTLWGWLPFVNHQAGYNTQRISLLIVIVLLPGAYLAAMGLYAHCRRRWGQTPWLERAAAGLRLGGSFLVFAEIYLACLAFSFEFTQPTPDINDRMLSPFHLAMLVVISTLVFALATLLAAGSKWNKAAMAGSFLIVILYVGQCYSSTYEIVATGHAAVAGYASPFWRNSPTIQAIRQLPDDVVIITNESALVLFQTNRPAYDFVEVYRSTPLPIDTRFEDDTTAAYQEVFHQNKAALVLFFTINSQLDRLYFSKTDQRIQLLTEELYLYHQFNDGAIYFYKPR